MPFKIAKKDTLPLILFLLINALCCLSNIYNIHSKLKGKYKITPYKLKFSDIPKDPINLSYITTEELHTENLILNVTVYQNASYLQKPFLFPVDDGPDIPITHEDYIKQEGNINTLNYYMYENVYIANPCAYTPYPQTSFYRSGSGCTNKFAYGPRQTKFGDSYGFGVGMCHKFSGIFGHLIVDYLPILLQLPLEIKERGKFLVNTKGSTAKQYYPLIGIKTAQFSVVSDNKYYFIRHYFTIHPLPCGTPNLFSMQRLRAFFIKKFKIKPKTPTKNVVLLRERRPFNTNLFELISGMYSNIKWELYKPLIVVKDVAIYFHDVRLFWTVHGSNQANIIFMQEGTVLCDLHVSTFIDFYMRVALSLNIHIVMIRDPRMKRDVVGDYPLPVEQIKYQIDVALSILSQNA